MVKETMKRITARPTKNGIVFISSIVPVVGLETVYDNERIKTRKVPTEAKFLFENISDYEMGRKYYSRRIALAVDTLLLALTLILTRDFHAVLSVLYFSFLASFSLFEIGYMVYQTKRKKGLNYTKAKYEATCNKIMNAFLKAGSQIPSIEDVKKAPIYDKRGNKYDALFIKAIMHTLVSILLYFLKYLDVKTYFLYFGILMLATIFFEAFHGFRLFQKLVMNEPSYHELVLGYEGLKEYLKMESEYEKDKKLTNALGFCMMMVNGEIKVVPIPNGAQEMKFTVTNEGLESDFDVLDIDFDMSDDSDSD